MRLLRDLAALARARAGVADAERRLRECEQLGHQWDDSVPSPPGMRYCSRCQGRYPEE